MVSVTAAVVLAVMLFAAGSLAPRAWLGRAARETGIVFGLYAVWQLLLDAVVVHTAGAVARGRGILDAERWLHVPAESTVQHWFLPHRWMLSLANTYYAVAHYPDVIALLVWLFFWHPARYRWGRALLIVATGLSVPLQGVPVAPPRLVPGIGVVDTARLLGQAVYSPAGLRDPAQLTAMPSVHVLWASIAAAGVLVVSRSRWRWLVLLHVVATFSAVVVTGNHWWLDGLASLAIIGVALAACSRSRHRQPGRMPVPVQRTVF